MLVTQGLIPQPFAEASLHVYVFFYFEKGMILNINDEKTIDINEVVSNISEKSIYVVIN